MTSSVGSQTQRWINHRIAAHRMARRGQSVESIAGTLHVTLRSVHRYLALPCPSPLPAQEDKKVSLANFYLKGACGAFPDLDWVSRSPIVQAEAKAICTYCPVLAECRDYALTQGRDESGVWGAMTKAERQREIRRRNRRQRQPAAAAQVREAS